MQSLQLNDLREYVENEVICPEVTREISQLIKTRDKWKIVCNVTEISGHICTAIATVLAFSSGVYSYEVLSYLAGCINIISLVLLRFSSYAEKESRNRNERLNAIYVKLNIPSSTGTLHTIRNNNNISRNVNIECNTDNIHPNTVRNSITEIY